MDLTSPDEIKALMRKNNIKFNKSFGQNFLICKNTLEKILDAAELDGDSAVLEIGAGLGTLTQALAQRAGTVVALEIDRALCRVLRSTFAKTQNVEIIETDILKRPLDEIFSKFGNRRISVVANLPYYITTPILMRLLEGDAKTEISQASCKRIAQITVMVQKEVADRIVATCDDKEYGALSVAVQYYSLPRIICSVPPECFMPPPKVASAVVQMKIREKAAVDTDKDKLFNVVKASFAQRRKTLINAIAGSGEFHIEKEALRGVLADMGLDERVRGEKLSIEQFAQLAERLYQVD